MSFEQVVNKYNGLIVSIASSYSSKINKFDDMYQECLTKLWEVFDDYDDNYEWSTYISNICKNHLHNIVKAENTLKRVNHTTSGKMVKDYRIDDKRFKDILEDMIDNKNDYTEYEKIIINRSMEILKNHRHKNKIWSVLKGETYRSVGEQYGVSKQRIYKIYKDFINEVKQSL